MSLTRLPLRDCPLNGPASMGRIIIPSSDQYNAGVSCGRARLPGGPARRVLRRRRDSSGRQLHAELGRALSTKQRLNAPPTATLRRNRKFSIDQ